MTLKRPLTSHVTISSIPRSVKQVRDMKYTQHKGKPDPIDAVRILMMSEKGSKERFIRSFAIKDDSFTLCLYTDEQFKLLCNFPEEIASSVIHVDTTFNLCNMFALVMTLRSNSFLGSPIMLGPILLTDRQRSKDYSILWEDLKQRNLRLGLASLTFVTDGEKAITESLKYAFPHCKLLRCMLHLKENVQRKARELDIPNILINSIKVGTDRLINCKYINFKIQMEENFEHWLAIGKDCHCQDAISKFINYYKKIVVPVLMENNTDVIQHDGHLLTNNASESMNAILKKWRGPTKLSVDELCIRLKEGAMVQNEELRKSERGISRRYFPSYEETKELDG